MLYPQPNLSLAFPRNVRVLRFFVCGGRPAFRVSHLLNIVVTQSSSILKLLSGEDQTLLVWGNALLILDLGLDIIDGIGALTLECDGLARKGLDEAFRTNVSIAVATGRNRLRLGI
jgi:hypothetical protein